MGDLTSMKTPKPTSTPRGLVHAWDKEDDRLETVPPPQCSTSSTRIFSQQLSVPGGQTPAFLKLDVSKRERDPAEQPVEQPKKILIEEIDLD